jgi:TldD protein
MVRLVAPVFLAEISPLAAQQSSSAVLEAMKAELARSQATFKSQPVPPYYIGYQITETHNYMVRGEFGRLVNSSENRSRQLHIDLRVGDYAMDNTREIRGEFNFPQFAFAVTPIDDDVDAIRAALWHTTDQR